MKQFDQIKEQVISRGAVGEMVASLQNWKTLVVLGSLMAAVVGVFVWQTRSPVTSAVDSQAVPQVEASSLGVTEALHQAQVALAQGHYDHASGLLLETLKQYPGNLEVMLQLGMTYRKAENFNASDTIYRMAIELHPKCVSCLNNRSVILMHLEQPIQAVALLQQAIARDPGYMDAHFNLGVAYDQAKQYRSAIASYENYLSMAVDSVDQSTSSLVRERIRQLETEF